MWLMPLSTLLSPHHDWQASPKMPTCKFCPRNMLPYTAKRTLQMESEKVKVAQSCPTLCDPMDYNPCSPWDSPGQNTGVGSLSLLQRIFSTQGLNPGLPHCRQTLTNWATKEVLADGSWRSWEKWFIQNFQGGLNQNTGTLKSVEAIPRGGQRETRSFQRQDAANFEDQQKGPWTEEAEQLLESGKGKESSPLSESPKRNTTLLIPRFWPSELKTARSWNGVALRRHRVCGHLQLKP